MPGFRGGPLVPVTVLVTTRNEEINIGKTLKSVAGFANQVMVIDSDSSDRTTEIARQYTDEVFNLEYDHDRIIPWIFQWALDNLEIKNEWVLILEADQVLTLELKLEMEELFQKGQIEENGFYIRREQVFRGKVIRHGGYGTKYLLKLFRHDKGELDAKEQDTRVYVEGKVGRFAAPLIEENLKEAEIMFYLEKHLRYAQAFAAEEYERRQTGIVFKQKPSLFGRQDLRVLWLKSIYYRMPLYVRPFLYFIYRYFLRLGFLDGKEGFIFHFLQAFWFRLVVDVRLDELLHQDGKGSALN